MFYFKRMRISKMWGYKDIEINFNKDINIFIGRNASGKTTILNLLYSISKVDLNLLIKIDFEIIRLELLSFNSNRTKTIVVTKTDEGIEFKISRKSYFFNIKNNTDMYILARNINRLNFRIRFLQRDLADILPMVWLPVNRRLPIPDSVDIEYRPHDKGKLESVDECLSELLERLRSYRYSLESEINKRYKEFEKQVLSEILYSKEHDSLGSIDFEPPTQEERKQLMRAFEVANLIDEKMKKRIKEHFHAVEDAQRRRKNKEDGEPAIDIKDIFVIPLNRRTKSLVRFAADLEKDRKELFGSLELYQKMINDFIVDKAVSVDQAGELNILEKNTNSYLESSMMSSGEKQILILLTQALLMEDSPVIYLADEPELSLHVIWQSKLIKCLHELGNMIQLVVATHSPDIVSDYREKVFDLGRN